MDEPPSQKISLIEGYYYRVIPDILSAGNSLRNRLLRGKLAPRLCSIGYTNVHSLWGCLYLLEDSGIFNQEKK